ncbi:MAG: phosphopantetheine-binding protein, partial [Pseudomonadota bacterium]
KLPMGQRPAVIKLVSADLPRTATRKIQRKACKKILERIVEATPQKARGGNVAEPVAEAVAHVANIAVSKIKPDTNLREDLNFDSLMAVELASALSGIGNANPDPDELARCETVADLVELIGARIDQAQIEVAEADAEAEKVVIPLPVAAPLKSALGSLQEGIYGRGLRAKVYGRSNIPANRPTIVVSNHCSHLDMGLVKYSLGSYGKKLVGLAAK